MKIIEKIEEKNTLKLVVSSNEESLFFLVKVYLEKMAEVDIVGIYKSHHLVDKTEFYLKTKSESPIKVLVKALKEAKKDSKDKKLK